MNSQLNALTIRRANGADAYALHRLAQLDSADAPVGDMIVAESDGELLAAVPVDGGRAVADPFRRTADIVKLLRTRAAQLRVAR
jgi:hypothetical protein